MTLTTPRRLPRFLVLAAVTFALLLTAAAKSQASYVQWSCTLPSGGKCVGSPHSLRDVMAWEDSTRLVGASASPTGSPNDIRGGFTWGAGYTCRGFFADMLYPVIANGSTSTLSMTGLAEFGTGAEGC